MAQPGDPYAEERARRQAATVSHGGNGYAALAHARVQADLMYLSRYRIVGASEAGAEVCARYGHDPRGRICQRCGQPTL